jgi:hypothetical protein
MCSLFEMGSGRGLEVTAPSGKQDMLADRSVSLAGTEQAAEYHGKIVGSIGAAVVQALDVIAQPSHQLQSCAREA